MGRGPYGRQQGQHKRSTGGKKQRSGGEYLADGPPVIGSSVGTLQASTWPANGRQKKAANVKNARNLFLLLRRRRRASHVMYISVL